MSGFLFGGSGSGKDLFARDQIALTNLRLMLQTGIATGALLSGYQWELLTDEWGASSANETYVSNYYTNSILANVGTATETATGTNVALWGWGGVTHWGIKINSGAYTSITAAKIVTSSNPNGTAYAQVWTDNAGTPGAQVGTNSPTVSVVLGLNSVTFATPVAVTTATDYWIVWVAATAADVGLSTITGSSYVTGGQTSVAITDGSRTDAGEDLMIGSVLSAISDMVLIPGSSITVAAVPSFLDAYFLWKDDSGSSLIGTDLTVDLSRDGGTTWSAASLSVVVVYDASYSVLKARADVSAQPSGTAMLLRIKTLNVKAQRVAAPAIYSEG